MADTSFSSFEYLGIFELDQGILSVKNEQWMSQDISLHTSIFPQLDILTMVAERPKEDGHYTLRIGAFLAFDPDTDGLLLNCRVESAEWNRTPPAVVAHLNSKEPCRPIRFRCMVFPLHPDDEVKNF